MKTGTLRSPLLPRLFLLLAGGASASNMPAQTFELLYSFQGGADGDLPGELSQGNDGNFYGTTSYGGNTLFGGLGAGTVFRVSPQGAFVTVATFDGTNGALPARGIVQGTDGHF